MSPVKAPAKGKLICIAVQDDFWLDMLIDQNQTMYYFDEQNAISLGDKAYAVV